MNYVCHGCAYSGLTEGMINCPECGVMVENTIASQRDDDDGIVIPPHVGNDEIGLLTDAPTGGSPPAIPADLPVITTPPAQTVAETEPPQVDPLPVQPPPISPPPPVAPAAGKVASSGSAGNKCIRCGCSASAAICDICAALPEPALILQVEGFEPLIYRGRKVFRIAVLADVVSVGRRDPATQTYPDIDLREFHANDVGFTSRRQAEIVYDNGGYHVTDLGGKETTQFAPDANSEWQIVPLNERCELKVGSRVMFGEAVSLHVLDPKNL